MSLAHAELRGAAGASFMQLKIRAFGSGSTEEATGRRITSPASVVQAAPHAASSYTGNSRLARAEGARTPRTSFKEDFSKGPHQPNRLLCSCFLFSHSSRVVHSVPAALARQQCYARHRRLPRSKRHQHLQPEKQKQPPRTSDRNTCVSDEQPIKQRMAH